MPEILSADLNAIVRELNDSTRVADELVGKADDAAFQRPPRANAWSASECIQHLSISNRTMLPRIDRALLDGKTTYQAAARTYSRDVWGWMLCALLEPPPRKWNKVATLATFVPVGQKPKSEVIAEFRQLQGDLIARVRRADGLDLEGLRVASPFNEKVKYNIYSAFRIITAHNRRHLWQANNALVPAGVA